MTMHEPVLRMTGQQHARLYDHLFPGDGEEAAAVALCGRLHGATREVLSVHRIHPIPYSECEVRTPRKVRWPTSRLAPLLDEAENKELAILKIHSHPTGHQDFSSFDDEADRRLFRAVFDWISGGKSAAKEQLHASAVMLPNGGIFARQVGANGPLSPIPRVAVCGDDIHFWSYDEICGQTAPDQTPTFARRHAQAFGARTTHLLGRLSVAVVGCSGTGSPVVEQLARFGVGELVLVDPDDVEEKNLNRILNTTREDAVAARPKVEVLAEAIRQMDLGTRVVAMAKNLYEPEVVRRVAACDVLFGCMDSVDGRHLLNHIAAYYCLPYIDIGVRIDADERGQIEQACGVVHYLQPDGSSLLSRGIYTPEELRAAGLRRTDPEAYAQQLEEKYIKGVNEERPAVISLNMQTAGRAVNELLARLHPFRLDRNKQFARTEMSLSHGETYHHKDGEPCPLLASRAGRGDARPLCGMAELSQRRRAA